MRMIYVSLKLHRNIFEYIFNWTDRFDWVFSCFSTRNLLKCIEYFKRDVVCIHQFYALFYQLKPVIEYLNETRLNNMDFIL